MKRAIKVLEARIQKINNEMSKVKAVIDEPEMLADYHFAMADLGNLELEKTELIGAIKILNGQLRKSVKPT